MSRKPFIKFTGQHVQYNAIFHAEFKSAVGLAVRRHLDQFYSIFYIFLGHI